MYMSPLSGYVVIIFVFVCCMQCNNGISLGTGYNKEPLREQGGLGKQLSFLA